MTVPAKAGVFKANKQRIVINVRMAILLGARHLDGANLARKPVLGFCRKTTRSGRYPAPLVARTRKTSRAHWIRFFAEHCGYIAMTSAVAAYPTGTSATEPALAAIPRR
jgi:hypothetical protein